MTEDDDDRQFYQYKGVVSRIPYPTDPASEAKEIEPPSDSATMLYTMNFA